MARPNVEQLQLGLITQPEAARRLGVARQRVAQLLTEGKLAGAQIDGVTFVYARDVARLLDERAHAARAQ